MKLNCRINGITVEAEVVPRLLLSDFLRHELKLTGTHVGCEMGACGACTIILDGEPIRSCLMFAVQAHGANIVTVEGLATGDRLSPVQEAFHRHHALQCGFCTPGLLTTVTAVARQGGLPRSEEAARALLSGNICRCTGYQNIVDAVLDTANETRSI